MSMLPFFFGRRDDAFDPFSLEAWEPIEGFLFPSASSSLARLSPGHRLPFPSPAASGGLPAFALAAHVDWKETPAAHVFKADLPGVRKDEVKVEVEDGRVLQISGERTREQEEKTDTWHRVERSSGRFLRRFRLPEDAKVDKVRAAMENGVLTVTVPKGAEARKPNVRSVEISG